MSYYDLAKLFKDRDNKESIGAIVGRVVNINPIKISIFDGQVLLEQEHLYICNSLTDTYKREFTVSEINGITSNNSDHTHNIENLGGLLNFTDTLNINDDVLLITTANEQMFFIIDKVVKL